MHRVGSASAGSTGTGRSTAATIWSTSAVDVPASTGGCLARGPAVPLRRGRATPATSTGRPATAARSGSASSTRLRCDRNRAVGVRCRVVRRIGAAGTTSRRAGRRASGPPSTCAASVRQVARCSASERGSCLASPGLQGGLLGQLERLHRGRWAAVVGLERGRQRGPAHVDRGPAAWTRPRISSSGDADDLADRSACRRPRPRRRRSGAGTSPRAVGAARPRGGCCTARTRRRWP